MKFAFLKTKKDKTVKHLSWNPIHPRKDWQYALIIFVALTIGIGLWSAYIFYDTVYSKDNAMAPHTEGQNSTAKDIEKISAFFEKRK